MMRKTGMVSSNPDPALSVKDKWGAVTVSQWRQDFLEDWQQRMDRAQSKKGTP